MTHAYPTIENVIGRTPLVRLQRLPGESGEPRGNVIVGKLIFEIGLRALQ